MGRMEILEVVADEKYLLTLPLGNPGTFGQSSDPSVRVTLRVMHFSELLLKGWEAMSCCLSQRGRFQFWLEEKPNE
jgi:hypothetical protein